MRWNGTDRTGMAGETDGCLGVCDPTQPSRRQHTPIRPRSICHERERASVPDHTHKENHRSAESRAERCAHPAPRQSLGPTTTSQCNINRASGAPTVGAGEAPAPRAGLAPASRPLAAAAARVSCLERLLATVGLAATVTGSGPGRRHRGPWGTELPGGEQEEFAWSEGRDEGDCPPQCSRKDKSLGLLSLRFLRKLPPYAGPTHTPDVSLDQAATELGVERRRIYDIVNVLESLELMSRVAKNRYSWHGRDSLVSTLENLQAEAQRQGYPAKLEGLLQSDTSTKSTPGRGRDGEAANSAVERRGIPEREIKMEPDDSEDNARHVASGSGAPAAGSRKEKSLRMMSQKFVMLFLVSRSRAISLDMAAQILICDTRLDDGHSKSTFKTKVRRLYDIANVLSSLGLIQKVRLSEGGGRKPAFQWIGVDGAESLDKSSPSAEEATVRDANTQGIRHQRRCAADQSSDNQQDQCSPPKTENRAEHQSAAASPLDRHQTAEAPTRGRTDDPTAAGSPPPSPRSSPSTAPETSPPLSPVPPPPKCHRTGARGQPQRSAGGPRHDLPAAERGPDGPVSPAAASPGGAEEDGDDDDHDDDDDDDASRHAERNGHYRCSTSKRQWAAMLGLQEVSPRGTPNASKRLKRLPRGCHPAECSAEVSLQGRRLVRMPRGKTGAPKHCHERIPVFPKEHSAAENKPQKRRSSHKSRQKPPLDPDCSTQSSGLRGQLGKASDETRSITDSADEGEHDKESAAGSEAKNDRQQSPNKHFPRGISMFCPAFFSNGISEMMPSFCWIPYGCDPAATGWPTGEQAMHQHRSQHTAGSTHTHASTGPMAAPYLMPLPMQGFPTCMVPPGLFTLGSVPQGLGGGTEGPSCGIPWPNMGMLPATGMPFHMGPLGWLPGCDSH